MQTCDAKGNRLVWNLRGGHLMTAGAHATELDSPLAVASSILACVTKLAYLVCLEVPFFDSVVALVAVLRLAC